MPVSAPPTFSPAKFGIALGALGTVLTSTGPTTAPTFQAASGGGLANPSALVGLAAVNGVALTGLRSDGAPALDQSIAPTWTGAHIFTNATPIKVSSAEPRVLFNETDQAADEKLWDIDVEAKVFRIRSRTDADGAGIDILSAARGTGTAVTTINIGQAGNAANTTFLGGGTVNVTNLTSAAGTLTGANLFTSSAAPRIRISETDQGTDLKQWAWDFAAGVCTYSTRTDADGAGKNILVVTRGPTTAIASIAVGNATDNPPFNFLGTGLMTVGGGITSAGSIQANANAITVASSAPKWRLSETDAGTDLKNWQWTVDATVMKLQTANDALAAGKDIFSIARGATTAISGISIGNATDNNTVTFLGTGLNSFGGSVTTVGALTSSRANAVLELADTGAAADEGRYQLRTTANSLTLRTINDSSSTARTILAVGRGAAQAVATISLGNSTDNPAFAFSGSGNIQFGATATGAQTATFVATNKPGSGTAAPIAWLPVLTAGGTQGYIPIFGA